MSEKMKARIAIGALVVVMGTGLSGFGSFAGGVTSVEPVGYTQDSGRGGGGGEWDWVYDILGDQGDGSNSGQRIYGSEKNPVIIKAPEGDGWVVMGLSAVRNGEIRDDWTRYAESVEYNLRGEQQGVERRIRLRNYYGKVGQSGAYTKGGERGLRWDMIYTPMKKPVDIVPLTGSGAPNFVDVSAGDWFYGSLYRVINTASPVIKGYTDGTFKPGAGVTEVEALVMGLRAMGVSAEPVSDGDWASGFVQEGLIRGLISEAPRAVGATRGYVVNILDKVLRHYGDVADGVQQGYVDSHIKDLASIPVDGLSAVRNVYALGVMRGYTDGTIRIGSAVTRSEMVAMLERVLFRSARLSLLIGPEGQVDVGGRYFRAQDIHPGGSEVVSRLTNVFTQSNISDATRKSTVNIITTVKVESSDRQPGYKKYIITVKEDESEYKGLTGEALARAKANNVYRLDCDFIDLHSQTFLRGSFDFMEGEPMDTDRFHGYLNIEGEKVDYYYAADKSGLSIDYYTRKDMSTITYMGNRVMKYTIELPEWYKGLGILQYAEGTGEYVIGAYLDSYRGGYLDGVYASSSGLVFDSFKGKAPNLRGIGGDTVGDIEVLRIVE